MKRIQLKWDLEDILEGKNWEEVFKKTKEQVDKAEEWTNKLDPKMEEEEFRKLMLFLENLEEKLSRVGHYPYLKTATDQKDKKAWQLREKADDLGVEAGMKTRIIDQWIKGIAAVNGKKLDEKNAKRLFGAVKDLEYKLKRSREAAKYSLNQEEENIILNKDVNGIERIKELRTIIETEQEYQLRVEGEEERIVKTQAELTEMVRSSQPEVREAAYRALLNKFGENLDKYWLVYKGIIKDWVYESKLRGYQSPIAAKNFGNEISGETVEVLLGEVKNHREVFQKYFGEKARALRNRKLRRFDVYAPIGRGNSQKISADEAIDLVLEAFGNFDPGWQKAAKQIVENNHIDYLPSPTKRGGAFCSTVGPKIDPYVMLNLVGSQRDVSVMAHELGHGIHSIMANKHYPSTQHASLVLSETASTLGEIIIFDRIIEGEGDKERRKFLLNERLTESYATVLRQGYITIFEEEIFNRVSKIDQDGVNQLWTDNLKEQFGDEVEIDEIFGNEWAYVSHLANSPFYCYAYSFGQLLALGLYKRYQQDKGYAGQIRKILEAGGSKAPEEILKSAGIEVSKPDFWKEGFEVIEGWREEFERDY
jgi:oligoendopeptidase F